MVRHNPDYDFDEEEYYYESEDPLASDDDKYPFDEEEDVDTIPPQEFPRGERGVEISMEVDAEGKEIWYAEDPQVPGSTSIGHSAEEAIEGVSDRRQQYRDMLRKSRDDSLGDEDAEPIPPPEHVSGEHDVDISMEVDESGREVWYAKDPRVPGSHSIGKSAEEAVDGLEDRRKEYREMLKKSREKRKHDSTDG
jgi:predicted RNase H-like HicB family nuclease